MIQYSESIANALHSPVMYWGFPDSSVGKESTCNAGDPGLISVKDTSEYCVRRQRAL